jgi:GNAT superfamily N-acetyltransferase
MIIRAAKPEESATLGLLYAKAAALMAAREPLFFRSPDPEGMAEQYRARLLADEEGQAVLVAEVDNVIVGFIDIALLMPVWELNAQIPRYRLHVEELFVEEEARGSGIGLLLLETAERWAVERGADLAMLDVDIGNADAIQFYEEKAGYSPLAQVMFKPLAE